MIRRPRHRLIAGAFGALAIVLLLTACNSSSNPTTSPSASPTVDTCASLQTLDNSVQALLSVKPLQVGTSGVEAAVSQVQTDLDAAAGTASTQFGPQIDALKQSVQAVSDTLTSANGQSIATVATQLATELPAVKTAWDNLQTAVSSLNCGLSTPTM